jgi:imidazolonepropionase-like amidohydrolase
MRIAIGLLFLVLAAVAFAQEPSDQQKPLAFKHVTVIDAIGTPEQPDRTVVISKGRITTIGESGKVRIPPNADVVDAAGKFLIPGLWDMHVHWYDKDYLPLFIANGITGMRVMWGVDDHHRWREQIEKGELLGPHMVIASPIIDGPKPYWPGSVSVTSEAEARQVVLKAKSEGADFIKVYSFLPRGTYFAIADEAKREGIPFVGHVPTTVSAKEASDAGQKSIEHLTGVLQACSRQEEAVMKVAQEDFASRLADPNQSSFNGFHQRLELRESLLENYDPNKATQLFEVFKRNGTWQVPTLTVLRAYAYLDDPDFVHDPRLKYMPPSVRSLWDPNTNPVSAGEGKEGFVLGKRGFEKDLQLVGAMHRAGVRILAGTDVLNPFCFPGFSLHDELELLVKAGLSPMAALQTATINPAIFLGKEKDMGTIEKGKVADLVLLDANPLADISNTKKINAVVVGGKLFPRDSLDQMLSHAEALASRKSIAEAVFKTINENGIDSAIKQYHELRNSQPDTYDFSEGELNSLGYQLLRAKKIKEAIEILKLNVEVFPSSYNTYDSLGEAYTADGQNDLAVRNYRKSLELNPKNTNASDMLKKLSRE